MLQPTQLANDQIAVQSCGTFFQMTFRTYICFIVDNVSAKTENIFIWAVISGYYYVACLWLFSP